MNSVRIVIDASPGHVGDAAQTWAEATAARDGEPEVAPLNVARPMIARIMKTGADPLLFTAIAEDGRPLGFAVTERTSERCAELRYLGVRPTGWGQGVAGRLLNGMQQQLRGRGYTAAELWVYGDNERAVGLYERHGWRARGGVRVHPRSGRKEHRYVLAIGPG